MSAGRPAEVKFYFDADVLGVAKVLAGLRPDITYCTDPGGTVHKRTRPPSPIQDRSTPDDQWIPTVTAAGLLIITRDSRIQTHRAELAAVRDSGARMVALAGEDAKGTWAQLEILMTRWRSIEALLDRPGPFIYAATRTALKQITLA